MESILPVVELFSAALTKSEFKDKVGRLIQYGCRGLTGVVTDLGLDAKESVEQLKAVQGSMAEARRVGRFFKELTVAPTILKELEEPDPINRACTVVSKVSLVLFFVIDHVAQLQKWKFLSSETRKPADTVKLALKLFTLAHAANLVLQLKRLKEELELEGTPKYNQAKRDAAALNASKAALLVFQGLHVSGLLETRDSLVGFAGVASSLLELHALWPAKPKSG